MKILQVNNNHFIKGGSDTVYFGTSALLSQAGHEVIPFAGQSDQDQETPFAAYFPQAAQTGSPRLSDLPRYLHNRDARRSMARLVGDQPRIDLAHLHIYYGRVTASILPVLRRAGIPIVQSLHEYKLACPVYTMERGGRPCEDCVTHGTWSVLRHRCKNGSLAHSLAMLTEFWSSRLQGDVRLIDRLICVSEFQRGVMRRAGLPQDKLVTLHNFIDTDAFTPQPGGDYLLYFGRIELLKGVETLLDAVAQTGHRLEVAGTGAWGDALKARVDAMSNVTYRGFVAGQELRDLVAGAQAVVVPSEWYENCPMSVLEAKASATPVIGARIGGIPELIHDGVDGFLFEPGDVDDLIRTLARLDQADTAAMGDAAREDAVARFAPAPHLDQLVQIYDQAIAGG